MFCEFASCHKIVASPKIVARVFLSLSLCAGVAVDNPNAVVVGLAPSQFHYNRLNEAFRLAVVCHSLDVYSQSAR